MCILRGWLYLSFDAAEVAVELSRALVWPLPCTLVLFVDGSCEVGVILNQSSGPLNESLPIVAIIGILL